MFGLFKVVVFKVGGTASRGRYELSEGRWQSDGGVEIVKGALEQLQ